MNNKRSLIRFGGFPSIWDEFDGFFDYGGPLTNLERSLQKMRKGFDEDNFYRLPETNVEETKDNYIMSLQLPGVKKEDIKIKAIEGMLELAVESETEEKEEKKNYLRQEFRSQKFYRKFTLPRDTKLESIASEYKDGMLKITVPKVEPSEPKDDKKYIDVKVN